MKVTEANESRHRLGNINPGTLVRAGTGGYYIKTSKGTMGGVHCVHASSGVLVEMSDNDLVVPYPYAIIVKEGETE